MGDNNIVIKITTEANLDDAQKQIRDLTLKAGDLTKEIADLKKKEEEEIASIKKQAKAWEGSKEVLAEFEQQINATKDKYKELIDAKKAEQAENKKSIKVLNESIKAYKTLHGMTGRAVQQLRAMREEMMRMEDAGEFGTKAYMDLALAAGELEDKIGDVQQRIRVLASDTKEMDALMGLGEGLAGGFYMATSGAEVFGEDLEGLQKAFYKVQAATSMLSGAQQIYNAFQKESNLMVVASAAYEKISASWKLRRAAATNAETVALGGATAAQWNLNVAMDANPIGATIALVVAGTAYYIAWAIAIYKLVHSFTAAGKAEKEYEKSEKELDKIRTEHAVKESARANMHSNEQRRIDNEEEKALQAAKKRNASELEMAEISAKYAKERAVEQAKYSNDEIKRNNDEVEELRKMRDAKYKLLQTERKGSKDYVKVQKELAEAEDNYQAAVQKGKDLENDRTQARLEAQKADDELAKRREELQLQTQRVNIELMRAGSTKEIAQIKLDYKEKLKTLQGDSDEEIKLRKALESKMWTEIQAVKDKYAQQARQTEIQSQRNLLKLMSQSFGTEEDYKDQLKMQKDILKAEADDQIKALEASYKRREISEKEMKVQVEAIRLQLNDDLRKIEEEEADRLAENQRRLTDIAVKEAEARKNALTGAEGVDEQKAVLEDYYAARQKQLEQEALLEKQAIELSLESQEIKDAKIRAIDAKLNADRVALQKEANADLLAVDEQYLTDLELQVAKAEDALSRAKGSDKLGALRDQYDAQLALYDEQQRQLQAKYDAGLITYQDYKQQEWEITKATVDAEVEYQQNAIQAIADGFQTALGYMQQVSDLAFDAINQNIQAEMDALDEEYTTDWEEAQKNADKKYITEKEYEKKKAALEEKQAKYAKAQALTNIAIQTALAIMNAMATAPFPINVIQASLAGAMGAAQLAVAASKPLAQYEKGRKGGKGEYALVGEKGPEIMYVPQGASIVPNSLISTPDAWGKFGVPELPHTDREVMLYAAEQTAVGLSIDYDRLGAAVAAAMPKQRNVTVNVDRSGVHVNNGSDHHTYLNAKYQGSWN